jgi:CheY-like chemotaxis protein
MAGLDPKAWINLEKATVLLIEPNSTNLQILKQILAGFGVRKPLSCASRAEALDLAKTEEISLIVVSDSLEDGDGYEFVRELRQFDPEQNAFTPVIIVSGHTKRRNVNAARDCGANFVIAKPLSPQTLLERVLWVARESRPFIDTGAYLGPDRRFKDDEAGDKRRRRNDPVAAEYASEADGPDSNEIKGAA